MSNAPVTKYTDRDVREDDSLYERAIEWLESYQGEFEYLIDMKMRLGSGCDLTIPMVRGVLNCMRHDPRVMDLPAPLPPEVGTVTQMRPRNGTVKRPRDVQCDDITPHYQHYWNDYKNKCEGIPYPINRESYELPATVKVPFVVSRSGTLIHLVDTSQTYMEWDPEIHKWGFYSEPRLTVKLACKYPSWIRKGILLSPEHAERLLEEYCPHCAEVMS